MCYGKLFAPAIWGWLLFFVGFSVFMALANWQLNRAVEKEEKIIQRVLANREGTVDFLTLKPFSNEAVFRNTEAQGHWVRGMDIIQDNVLIRGVSGFHLLSPLKLSDGSYVLVNRGWKAWPNGVKQLPTLPKLPAGMQRIVGETALPLRRIELAKTPINRSWPKVVQKLEMDKVAQWLQAQLAPVLIHQRSDAQDGLVRQWKVVYGNPDKHRAYALQWFVFGIIFAVFFVALNRKAPAKELH